MAPGRKVPGSGPESAKLMVIGEAPGQYEERLGQPFVGPSGELLRDVMRQVGIDPSEVRFSNLCKFRPPGNELSAWFDSNGMPNATVMEGLAELKEEIEHVKPNCIVALGNFPLWALTGKSRWDRKNRGYTGIGDYRGSILQGSDFTCGRKVVAAYHPASILRQYPNKAILRLDLARAAKQREFPEIRPIQRTFVLDPRGDDRRYWLDRLATTGDHLTGDIEYIGERLLCVGLTSQRGEAVVLAMHDARDVSEVRSLLESGKPLVFQNGMFDCSILEWHYGIRCVRHLKYDTMIAAYNIALEFPKDLGFLASLYTEQPAWKGMVDWKKVAAGAQPMSDVLHYNAIDTWATEEIMHEQLAQDLTDLAFRASFDFDMSKLAPLWEMSQRGVRIDTAKLNSLKALLESEATTLQAGLAQIAGRSVNVKSGPQVVALLFESLGCPRGARTDPSTRHPDGQLKTDDKTLADVSLRCSNDTQRTAIKIIRETRERLDLVSKFCEIELDDDGRMRCHYDPAKTETGRLSSRKFYPTGRGSNLQNVPKDGRVRSVFIADPGYAFGYADLRQAESLVVSYLSGDPEMLRLHLTPGLDGHREVAAFLLSKPVDEITGDERYLGKRVRHGCNYSLGWKTLMEYVNADASKTGVSLDAKLAKRLVDRYRALHPYLVAWWAEIEAEVRATRSLSTLTGRKRVFYDRIDSIVPVAIAYKPQGTVADVLNIILVRCANDPVLAELDFQLLLQVHDAIGYQFPIEHTFAVNKRIRELSVVPLTVPKTGQTFSIDLEIKIGSNWGEFDPKKPDLNPGGLRLWEDDLNDPAQHAGASGGESSGLVSDLHVLSP